MISDFVWPGLRKKIQDLVFFFFFAMNIFIIILISYLYYFNQITKNIDRLMFGVKR